MKIKLIRYGYKDYEQGEVVDLGEDKNKSMVSINRAVWYDEGELKKKKREAEKSQGKPSIKAEEEVEVSKKKVVKKKVLVNKTREKISKKKKTNGFWDNLK